MKEQDRTTEDLVELVMARVREGARKDSPTGLRYAYGRVLDELQNEPDLQRLIGRDGDVLGAVYERVLPVEYRRPRGQFFTPTWAAEVMVRWLLESEPNHVLDPAVGSGSLILPMASEDNMSRPTLLGIDTDALALRLATANLAARGLNAQLVDRDFLVDDLPTSWPMPDSVICNPPYARHQALSASRKEAIHRRLTQVTGVRFDRNASMPALFLTRALEIASDDARLAFITPSGWLDANYARRVKEHLLDKAYVDAVIFLHDDHLFFDGVLTTSAITLIVKGSAPTGHRTALVRLDKRLPAPKKLLATLRRREATSADYVTIDKDWRAHARTNGVDAKAPLSAFATVHRGVATGKNDFFVVSEDTRVRHGLTSDDLRGCLATPKLFPGRDRITDEDLRSLRSGSKRWIIASTDPEAERATSSLGEYLRLGRKEAVHDGVLTSMRSVWYAIEMRRENPILFPYFNRAEPRFVRNLTDAVPLNNWLVIQPRPGVDADALLEVLRAPETSAAIDRVRRVYARGLWKVEPRDLSTVDLGEGAMRLLAKS